MVILLFAAARKWLGPTRWAAVALVSTAILIVGALDTPINYLRPSLTRASKVKNVRLTPQLYRSLTWIRDHTSTGAVIAVNARSPVAFNYSAF